MESLATVALGLEHLRLLLHDELEDELNTCVCEAVLGTYRELKLVDTLHQVSRHLGLTEAVRVLNDQFMVNPENLGRTFVELESAVHLFAERIMLELERPQVVFDPLEVREGESQDRCQVLAIRALSELPERIMLDLPNTLAGELHDPTDLVQVHRAVEAIQAVAISKHLRLELAFERGESILHGIAQLSAADATKAETTAIDAEVLYQAMLERADARRPPIVVKGLLEGGSEPTIDLPVHVVIHHMVVQRSGPVGEHCMDQAHVALIPTTRRAVHSGVSRAQTFEEVVDLLQPQVVFDRLALGTPLPARAVCSEIL